MSYISYYRISKDIICINERGNLSMMAALFKLQDSWRQRVEVHVFSYLLPTKCISPVSFPSSLSLSLWLQFRLAHIALIRGISQADVRFMNSLLRRYTMLLTLGVSWPANKCHGIILWTFRHRSQFYICKRQRFFFQSTRVSHPRE